MRKLIEKHQESLVTCDNPNCSYEIPYSDEKEKELILYIDKPCPICGDNLLTKEDYLQHRKLVKVIDFINKWFSWVTIFYSRKALKNQKIISVKVHDGIKIKDETI